MDKVSNSSRSGDKYPPERKISFKKTLPPGHLNIGVVMLSADYRVVGINKYAAEILQINAADIGKKIFKYHPPKTHARIKYLLEKASNALNDIPPLVIMNVRERVLAVNLCRIDIKEFPESYFLNISFIDITEQDNNRDTRKFGLKSIPIYEGGSYLFIDISSIHLIKSEGNYCKVFTESEQYYLRITLSEIEKKYTGQKLFKVHRSFLVNLDNVHRIIHNVKGQNIIDFNNKDIPLVPVARRRTNDLNKTLKVIKGNVQ